MIFIKKRIFYIAIIFLLVVSIICIIALRKEKKEQPPVIDPHIEVNRDLDFKLLKGVHEEYKENYLISPLSIAYALSMLKDGASDETRTQIENVLNGYNVTKITNIPNKISIANGLFIKNKYKNIIKEDYVKNLKNNYDADVIYDEFTTPEVINNWVNDKTFKMIPNALQSINPEFVLALANAIAIDVEWKSKFDCYRTLEDDFNLDDGTKMKTAMMNDDNVLYLNNQYAEGIIKDYKMYDTKTGEATYEKNDNTIELEYIAILPKTSLDDYIKIFNKEELDNLLKTKVEPNNEREIYLSLPKYTYDFDYETFENALQNMGITKAFQKNAEFYNMYDKDSLDGLYVSKAIHKSHIELSENGTKAAAVTIFTMDTNAIDINEKEIIKIKFDKPFIYIIKEKNNDNIWFMGAVYEPLKWEDNKSECSYN